jgi:hypothetical protein
MDRDDAAGTHDGAGSCQDCLNLVVVVGVVVINTHAANHTMELKSTLSSRESF